MYLSGTKFVLNSDHNPLTHPHEQKDHRGKFACWIAELEEYNYSVHYITKKFNVKADALSCNQAASDTQPLTEFEDSINALLAVKMVSSFSIRKNNPKIPQYLMLPSASWKEQNFDRPIEASPIAVTHL